jgi:hypothetical protein
MHAVIRRYEGNQLSQIMSEHTDEIRKLIGSVPGVREYYAIDGGSEVATVTICEDLNCTRETTRVAAEWVKKNVPASANLPKPQVLEGKTFLELSRQMASR